MPGTWSTSTTSARRPSASIQKRDTERRQAQLEDAPPIAAFVRPAMVRALSHSAWISTGLPVRGVTTQSPILASIHVSCTPRLPARQQAVAIGPDAETRAGGISGHDGLAPRHAAPVRQTRRRRTPSARAAVRKVVDGDHVPEGGIDGVVFGGIALIRKAVRQHALGHDTRPADQDVPRFGQPAGGHAQASQRDEGVAAPVGEPRVAGDDGLAGAAPHEKGIRRAVERRREYPPRGARAPAAARAAQARRTAADRPVAGVLQQRASRSRRWSAASPPSQLRSKVNVPGEARSSTSSSPRARSWS